MYESVPTRASVGLPAERSGRSAPPGPTRSRRTDLQLITGVVPGPLVAVVDMKSVANSSSGACGAKACQARIASAASAHGQTDSVVRDVPHRVRAEAEAGHDPEVPASAAATGPVQVGMLAGAALPQPPVGRDDRHAADVVAGEAELPARVARAAAERQAGRSRRSGTSRPGWSRRARGAARTHRSAALLPRSWPPRR